MLTSFLNRLLELKKPETVEINGQTYSTCGLNIVHFQQPKTIELHTLAGLVDYIKENPDQLNISELILHIKSPDKVSLRSTLYEDNSRENYVTAEAFLPKISLDTFVDAERFNIMLQSCFCQTDHTAAVLKVIGNIKDEAIKSVSDDGISQSVTVRQGIARAGETIVPNPVIIAPFRTFTEVPQPESRFVFRLQDGPKAGFFEADGGAWRIEAMSNIKEYLVKELEGLDVKIIS